MVRRWSKWHRIRRTPDVPQRRESGDRGPLRVIIVVGVLTRRRVSLLEFKRGGVKVRGLICEKIPRGQSTDARRRRGGRLIPTLWRLRL